jgi:hypothetical protein
MNVSFVLGCVVEDHVLSDRESLVFDIFNQWLQKQIVVVVVLHVHFGQHFLVTSFSNL